MGKRTRKRNSSKMVVGGRVGVGTASWWLASRRGVGPLGWLVSSRFWGGILLLFWIDGAL